MARVTAGPNTKSKKKKVFAATKGHYGRRRNCLKTARQSAEKAGQYAYRDRRAKKRNFRSLWIMRINAGAREHGMTYSVFMNGLKLAGIELDRKVLADIAAMAPADFAIIAKQVADALAKAGKKAA
ncbi:50S ribosomal protein L20 [Micavibrio aeruginosavorus]|uniref:Large ribosomal subunit protein bL20 n=1 Tax=Micavibrio aeruginosavorus EPB TaxID=349215 RepID=M4VKH8_9BACT|nr:50S ribosomal protein L20 [Micavibrio aeruginosavorus]AGH98985.1 LSU ribosomal protein L20p [Micavibrio aeruginosavorus EPB]